MINGITTYKVYHGICGEARWWEFTKAQSLLVLSADLWGGTEDLEGRFIPPL
jgi:hypothetical protein